LSTRLSEVFAEIPVIKRLELWCLWCYKLGSEARQPRHEMGQLVAAKNPELISLHSGAASTMSLVLYRGKSEKTFGGKTSGKILRTQQPTSFPF
jgi:hypothetical protein